MAHKPSAKDLGFFIVVVLGLFFAWYAGGAIVDDNLYPAIIAVGFAIALISINSLGNNVYYLIPVCWGLTGQIGVLPIPFSVAELSIVAASLYFVMNLIYGRKLGSPPSHNLSFLIWTNIIYLATAFFRNPVGFAFLGGSVRVGGKPYIDVMVGVMAYLLLSRYRLSVLRAKKIPLWSLYVAAFVAFAGGVGTYFPEVGNILGKFYNGFYSGGFDTSGMTSSFYSATSLSLGEDRLGFLQGIGSTTILYLVSQTNPTQFSLRQVLSYAGGIIMIMLSGFRSAFTNAFLVTVVGSIIREKTNGLIKIGSFTFVICLAGTLFSYTPISLPNTFQRTLSFLPGNWDPVAKLDAQGSSEWRFQMWEIALTSDKYIHNKIFGDGFGFLRADLENGIAQMMGQATASEGDLQQEQFLIDGDFHSGPVSAIRFVGVVGLILFILLMLQTTSYAWSVTKRSFGTGYQFCVLFFAIPAILYPIKFLFIFGDFKLGLLEILFFIGMLKMLEGSINDQAKLKAELSAS